VHLSSPRGGKAGGRQNDFHSVWPQNTTPDHARTYTKPSLRYVCNPGKSGMEEFLYLHLRLRRFDADLTQKGNGEMMPALGTGKTERRLRQARGEWDIRRLH
jgi:hypothetical protein